MNNNKDYKKIIPPPPRFSFRNILFLLIVFAVLMYFFSFLGGSPGRGEKEVTYTQFLQMVDEGKVGKVTIRGGSITGRVNEVISVRTFAPNDPELISVLQDKGVDIEVLPEGPGLWAKILGILFPVLIFAGLFFWLFRGLRGTENSVLSFGKSRARLSSKKTGVTFRDVAGAEEAKEELEEAIQFLKNPERFQKMGAKIPKGILLVGPPGCGKTLLAKAVAGEANVPFYSISGSDFVEIFVGVGAARVRDLFDKARKSAPCIIFIDELDAVGRQRFAGIGGGHEEKEQTLNQLLVELDGFSPREGIIVMGATNRPDVLDAALLRPGRFDRKVSINSPDVKEREDILRLHMRNRPLDVDVDVRILARRTPGFVGSDLENLVNEASLLAARKGEDRIGMAELEEAIDRVIAGPEKKSRIIREKEKEIVAIHEASHALVGAYLPHADPVHKISVIPRGSALGYTLQLPLEDHYITTRGELLDKVGVLLAGRAGEELIFHEISTGAQNDLSQATSIARKMVEEYGMSKKVGPVVLSMGSEEIFLGRDLLKKRSCSSRLAAEADREAQYMVEEVYQHVRDVLAKHKSELLKLAKELEEKEVLEEDDLQRILGNSRHLSEK